MFIRYLLKCNRNTLSINKNQSAGTHQKDCLNLIRILHSNDTIGKIDLVTGEYLNHTQLNTMLRMIAVKGSDHENLSERRKVNKTFLNHLVKIKGGEPSALVWLKRNIDFEICDILISDWKHTGT